MDTPAEPYGGKKRSTGTTAVRAGSKIPKVAVLRAADLETRELLLFDRLHESRQLAVTAVGDAPDTPYGIAGLSLDVKILPSVQSRLRSFPLGGRLASQLTKRFPSIAHSPGLEKVLYDFAVVNTRETFHSQSARAAELLTRRPDQRLVVSCFENIPFRYEEDEHLARNKDRVRAAADMFVANSPGARDALLLENVPANRVEMVPPGIDTDLFTPGPRSQTMRARWQANDDDLIILYAGRLLPEKGLIEALVSLRELLNSSRGGIKLVFHGAGPERLRLKRAASSLGLTGRVVFSDWVAPDQMPDVYRSGDLIVLPSLSAPYWREQFGYNLVEAMACGRPVIGASTGEIPWVLGSGGIVFDVERPAGLAEALGPLISDEGRRVALGVVARREALARFSVGVAGQQLVDCFRTAMSRPPRHAARRPS